MKLDYPATRRNREPLLQVLRDVLPTEGLVLEIGSGSGQHAVYFGAALAPLQWQPTDPEPDAVASIDAWREHEGVPNVRPALALDAREPWPIERADAVVCVNVVHISPWEVTEALIARAAAVLPAGAPMVLYGPYKVGGAHTADSNAAFDASLRARDPSWGVRDLEAVLALGEQVGLVHERTVQMPANNLTVCLRSGARGSAREP